MSSATLPYSLCTPKSEKLVNLFDQRFCSVLLLPLFSVLLYQASWFRYGSTRVSYLARLSYPASRYCAHGSAFRFVFLGVVFRT